MEILRINPKDNVAVALLEIPQNKRIELNSFSFVALTNIPKGHKIALMNIKKKNNVIKYGFPIGYATVDINIGDHVHTHNINTNLSGILNYTYNPTVNHNTYQNEYRSFLGYQRESGEVGIRNELWVIPTVGCVNNLADLIIKKFLERNNTADIDGVFAFKHPYGCSQLGDDLQNTKVILQDLVKHPNTGGVLILGLGCENNFVKNFEKTLGHYNKKRIKFIVAQEVEDEIEEGIILLKNIYEIMKQDLREKTSITNLKVGLKCGGSDGFSGITSNPLLGRFSDWLIAQGGTTVLTEVPEMFGAEILLMNRAENIKIFRHIVEMINDFKKYFLRYHKPIFENPSPGNKEGGISTLEDKSLGCIQKGGTSSIVDVLKYGEKIKSKKGVVLVSSPGNDGISSTVLGASGCQLILFTTGLGTPFGTFVPTLKISSNTMLSKKKPRWIDFNAGSVLEESKPDDLLHQLIDYVLSVASGKKTNNEIYDFREITIFKDGITL